MDEDVWVRDPTPMEVCKCGHSLVLHKIDTKAKPCSTGGCGCLKFRLGAYRWSERRTVTERIADPDG